MRSNYQNLIVWQLAIDLVITVYEITGSFPKHEIYGLTSQIRRSAVSIPSNIAEGSQKMSKKDFNNYLRIAKGSTAELETQLIIAEKLKYLNNSDQLFLISSKLLRIRRMLSGLYAKT